MPFELDGTVLLVRVRSCNVDETDLGSVLDEEKPFGVVPQQKKYRHHRPPLELASLLELLKIERGAQVSSSRVGPQC